MTEDKVKELQLQFPNAFVVLENWAVENIGKASTRDVDKELMAEVKANLLDTGIVFTLISNVLTENPSVLFPSFDKKKIYIDISRESGQFRGDVNKFFTKADTDRKVTGAACVVKALSILEDKLIKLNKDIHGNDSKETDEE